MHSAPWGRTGKRRQALPARLRLSVENLGSSFGQACCRGLSRSQPSPELSAGRELPAPGCHGRAAARDRSSSCRDLGHGRGRRGWRAEPAVDRKMEGCFPKETRAASRHLFPRAAMPESPRLRSGRAVPPRPAPAATWGAGGGGCFDSPYPHPPSFKLISELKEATF